MGVKNADLKDLLATTLADFPEQYFEVTWDNTDYEFCRIYQTERMEVDGGTHIERRVMFDDNGNATYCRLFDTDNPNIPDVMEKIVVPWTQLKTHYSWDKLEIIRNKNSAKGFIRLMESRRIAGLWSLAKLIERYAWRSPDSATDDLHPYGVPYYINHLDHGVTAAGFTGKQILYNTGTRGTICAGIDAAIEAKWCNYAATYSNVDNALLKTFRKAFLVTQFKAPLFINDPAQKRNAAKRIYCDADTAVALQDLADAKDDKHTGKEVLGNIRMDDGALVLINRLPVVYINQLDGYTTPAVSGVQDATETAPIYCIDFEKFIPYVQDGYWMEETEPISGGVSQHTVFTVFLDGSHNNLCVNRRTCGFVIHKSIVSA